MPIRLIGSPAARRRRRNRARRLRTRSTGKPSRSRNLRKPVPLSPPPAPRCGASRVCATRPSPSAPEPAERGGEHAHELRVIGDSDRRHVRVREGRRQPRRDKVRVDREHVHDRLAPAGRAVRAAEVADERRRGSARRTLAQGGARTSARRGRRRRPRTAASRTCSGSARCRSRKS
jgi:hypothetical protein